MATYLNKQRVLELIGSMPDNICFGCFDGTYDGETNNPVLTIEIPAELVPYVPVVNFDYDDLFAVSAHYEPPPVIKPQFTVIQGGKN